ncbi:MAG: hypothetical protein AAF184_20605 [Pseudomonadota bacterium]
MKLIFVYNANAGWLNSAWDSAHKLLSPSTYKCSLCAITHHPLGMRLAWSAFVDELGHEVEFLHRDEAAARYAVSGIAWPAVLVDQAGEVSEWLGAEALNQAETLEDLQRLIRKRLANHEP